MGHKPPAFAIWLTGLPASGKSTVASALEKQLNQRGIRAAVLESDALRRILTPQPTYSEKERELFYKQMAYIGRLLAEHGVPVIFDATANRRQYRDAARAAIPCFLEIYVECPLETCLARDPKGIYRNAAAGESSSVPGLQAVYEPPERPDLVIYGDSEAPEAAARRIVNRLEEKGYVSAHGDPAGEQIC